MAIDYYTTLFTYLHVNEIVILYKQLYYFSTVYVKEYMVQKGYSR
jgi:hypothetical protein